VHVTRPPITTVARGRCTSAPDPVASAIGTKPNDATSETEAEAPKTKPEIQYDDFAKLDLRVATIVEAEAHPNADRLLKLQVDLGGLGKRQICAGIRAYVEDPGTLVGKQIVVVANLAPRQIRGEQSNGMLLAASAMDGETLADVVLLTPGKPAPPGATVGCVPSP